MIKIKKVQQIVDGAAQETEFHMERYTEQGSYVSMIIFNQKDAEAVKKYFNENL